ncbi:MAG: DUF5343 domain-containing protein [Kiloniellales bacterium]
MTGKHPYISSGGPLVQAITQFRKSFPSTVDASTLKKLGIASNNESYLINIFKFLNLINDESAKTDKAAKAFVIHKDEDFQKAFSEIVSSAYSELFELHNQDAWTLDDESLITYFRQTDESTEIVGKRQALTFKALAGLSGKRELSTPRTTSPKKSSGDTPKKPAVEKKTKARSAASQQENIVTPFEPKSHDPGFGLTVRVEINLPADGSQATYDRIFKSIRENLIDAYKA